MSRDLGFAAVAECRLFAEEAGAVLVPLPAGAAADSDGDDDGGGSGGGPAWAVDCKASAGRIVLVRQMTDEEAVQAALVEAQAGGGGGSGEDASE